MRGKAAGNEFLSQQVRLASSLQCYCRCIGWSMLIENHQCTVFDKAFANPPSQFVGFYQNSLAGWAAESCTAIGVGSCESSYRWRYNVTGLCNRTPPLSPHFLPAKRDSGNSRAKHGCTQRYRVSSKDAFCSYRCVFALKHDFFDSRRMDLHTR